MERTFAIVKPDAVRRGLTGDILKRIEASGLKIVALRKIHLSRVDAEKFYDVHRARPFFSGLCDYMTSGPVVILVLQGEGAISKWRQLMGATDPKNADTGTIRKDFGIDVEKNVTHGSDAPETAAQEIAFFFPAREILA
ncbi:MAG TPA: nucleoside-diphosphate kinase [Candidatus Binatus sp.]|uniref:nucleoside-diphosphate kinase n=1 Tax=Candidatus Binatus sp. TaxID=2811406 RepID=UPI002B46DAAB|nr:nucleoside-diphosphate kinase [Candidatus Binatus sp.]HKN12915.1 nucleoside-diphosphate kinase [Candidatus Binatus sp.]